MHAHDQNYPWIFHRDEIDLLEDELEDLYEKYGRDSGSAKTFESAVLSEQMETEEQSDAQLSRRLGFDFFQKMSESLSFSPSEEAQIFKEDAHKETEFIRSHALYQTAKAWAAGLRGFTKQKYEEGGPYASEYFRMYANLNLVPLKIFTALSEELHEDRVGFEVAQEAYQLSLIYLERIQESLGLVMFGAQEAHWLERRLTETQDMRQLIMSQLNDLKRRRGL
jgi:hypothetical protein